MDIPPPTNWKDFEDLCCDLWRLIWNDPDASKNGRNGQPQAGVDIYGRAEGGRGWVGVQCKLKSQILGKKLTRPEIEAEVEKARSFQPALTALTIATTASRDTHMAAAIRAISDRQLEAGSFPVRVTFWEDILEQIEKLGSDHPELFHHLRVPQRPSKVPRIVTIVMIPAVVAISIVVFSSWLTALRTSEARLQKACLLLNAELKDEEVRPIVEGQKVDVIDGGICWTETVLEELTRDPERTREASELIEKVFDVIWLLPSRFEAHSLRLQLFVAAKDWEKAHKEATVIVQRYASNPEAHLLRGFVAFEAARFLDGVAEHRGSCPNARVTEALQEAESSFTNALQLAAKRAKQNVSDSQARALSFRGLTRILLREYDSGLKDLREAWQLKPISYTCAALGTGLLSYADEADGEARQEKLAEAKSMFSRCLELKAGHLTSTMNLADLHMELQDWDRAVEYAAMALRVRPNEYDLYRLRGQAFAHLGRYEEAISDFAKYSLQVPADPLGNHLLAVAYYRNGDRQRACEELMKARAAYEMALTDAPFEDCSLRISESIQRLDERLSIFGCT